MGKVDNEKDDQQEVDPSTITREQGYWQETCLGIWTKSKNQSHSSSEHPEHSHICNGINFVKIFNLDATKVKPSPTRGLQLIVVESKKKESIPLERNEPVIKKKQHEMDDKALWNNHTNQPYHRPKSPHTNNNHKENESMLNKISSVLYSKYLAATTKIQSLINSPHPKQDLMNDTKDLSHRYSSTIRHLYSHVKISERIDQTGKFVVARLKRITTWWENKGN
ncbi:hypothetical protein TrispH2_004675 [Trichoplax sp. H2]|nr:hypothetical protein TrispH2_004675 [Trichoplax sp. H2]|eukprot:RDD44264.1 hypothetical protein TrispH2_004675 [Trichoplax sp. H2]